MNDLIIALLPVKKYVEMFTKLDNSRRA